MKNPPVLGSYVVLASNDEADFYLVVNVCGDYVDLLPYGALGVKRRPITQTCEFSLVQYPQGKQIERLYSLHDERVCNEC